MLKAVFNVILVNIHLPFQHKEEVQRVRGSIFFRFHMGKPPLSTQGCGPKLCFTSYFYETDI